MRYLFQGWNCRMPGKYKDLIMDVATEEIGHVEMMAIMIARLLEGAPATATTKAAGADPVVGAVLGGMDPQQAIVAGGGGALLADSNGYPWNGRFIVASGNLLADFRANAAAEAQGRLQTARLYNMTDDLSDGSAGQTGGWAKGSAARRDPRVRLPARLRAARRAGLGPAARPGALRHLRRQHGQAQGPGHGHRDRPDGQDQGRPYLSRRTDRRPGPGSCRRRRPCWRGQGGAAAGAGQPGRPLPSVLIPLVVSTAAVIGLNGVLLGLAVTA
jgi:hypothetical protein